MSQKMLIRPKAKDWLTALRVHHRFASLPGSKHIASRISLAFLAAILRQQDCELALEFGAGIGTLTYLLLQSGLRVVALEDNPFCLDQLRQNVPGEWQSRLTLLRHPRDIDGAFDLVVIDGLFPRDGMLSFLRPGMICFIEGSRRRSISTLQERIALAGLHCKIENYEPWISLRLKVRRTGLRLRFKLRREKTCRFGIYQRKHTLIQALLRAPASVSAFFVKGRRSRAGIFFLP